MSWPMEMKILVTRKKRFHCDLTLFSHHIIAYFNNRYKIKTRLKRKTHLPLDVAKD